MGRAEALIDRLTIDEQVALLSGEDFWSLPAIPRLGIGKLRMTDGPNGARGSGSLVGGVSAAAFPVGVALGASWNPALAEEIGAAIAEEVRSKGAQVALAPTVNLQRVPTNGRHFEGYSEDPELSAALAVGYVRGLQSRGIAATVKHFAGNESELERTTVESVIDERTLREVYLRPFEAAVRDGGAWAVMSSYNKLNGVYTAENEWLLTQVLRWDWGFDGAVISDWFGSRSTEGTVMAGLDIEMPGPTRDRGALLLAAVDEGRVGADVVRERAMAVLRLIERVGVLDPMPPFAERAEDRPAHRALIRRAGAEGAVLLTNDGLLPLERPARIAVIGPNARVAQIMGGGSAQLNPHRRVSPWEGLVARCGEAALTHALGCTNHRWEPLLPGPWSVDFFAAPDLRGPVAAREMLDSSTAFWVEPVAGGAVAADGFSARVTGSWVVPGTGRYRVGLHNAGFARLWIDDRLVIDGWRGWRKGRTFFEEGNDELTADLELTGGQSLAIRLEFRARRGDNLQHAAFRFGIGPVPGAQAIAEAARVAAAADVALVFVGRSGEWDTEGWDMPDIALPGDQDALVRAVAAANPDTVVVLQTGGPVTMPWAGQVRAILQAWYPGQEAGHAIADVLFGAADPGGRLPHVMPAALTEASALAGGAGSYPGRDGQVRYAEGLLFGQRHHDRSGVAPLFPFGHGLSYAEFALSDLQAVPRDGGAQVSVRVTNRAARAGSTVVQLYLGDEAAPATRPLRALKGFAKVRLGPGETRVLTLDVPPRAFAFYDTALGEWMVEAGDVTLWAGFSAADLPCRTTLTIEAARLGR